MQVTAKARDNAHRAADMGGKLVVRLAVRATPEQGDLRGWCRSRKTTAGRLHVARMAGVNEVITHAPDCGMLALLWAWRSGANPLVRQALWHVSGPLGAGEGPSCRGA